MTNSHGKTTHSVAAGIAKDFACIIRKTHRLCGARRNRDLKYGIAYTVFDAMIVWKYYTKLVKVLCWLTCNCSHRERKFIFETNREFLLSADLICIFFDVYVCEVSFILFLQHT